MFGVISTHFPREVKHGIVEFLISLNNRIVKNTELLEKFYNFDPFSEIIKKVTKHIIVRIFNCCFSWNILKYSIPRIIRVCVCERERMVYTYLNILTKNVSSTATKVVCAHTHTFNWASLSLSLSLSLFDHFIEYEIRFFPLVFDYFKV